MEKSDSRRSDSGDGHLPSDTEKHIDADAPVGIIDLPPDPDEALTEEERKRIVSETTGEKLLNANC